MSLPLLLLAWFVGSPLVGIAFGVAIGRADERRRAADRELYPSQNRKSYNHRERN